MLKLVSERQIAITKTQADLWLSASTEYRDQSNLSVKILDRKVNHCECAPEHVVEPPAEKAARNVDEWHSCGIWLAVVDILYYIHICDIYQEPYNSQPYQIVHEKLLLSSNMVFWDALDPIVPSYTTIDLVSFFVESISSFVSDRGEQYNAADHFNFCGKDISIASWGFRSILQ